MLGTCHLKWAGRKGVRARHSEEESCTGRELQLTGSREKERLTSFWSGKKVNRRSGPKGGETGVWRGSEQMTQALRAPPPAVLMVEWGRGHRVRPG